jgi:hypothetical protein
MIENWSCLTAQDTTPYAEICMEAVENDGVFEKFKQDPRYTAILEHVSPEHGQKYFNGIMHYELDAELIEAFKENDKLGGANVIDYGDPFGYVSPSTLRYVQNTLDIAHFVGEGEINKIVEIGGGYGGLCKTISCLCDFDEYHIYDLEAASKLQEKYLSNFDVKDKAFFHSIPEKIEDVDLVISNYAYSELNLELQDLYYENVIKNAKRVYMILNRGEVSREVLLKRAEEDFEVSVEKVLDFWPPNGYLYYTTMVKK